MNTNHKKAILAVLIAVCIMMLFSTTAFAGTVRVGTTDTTDCMQYHNSSGWHDLNTPNHYIVGTNEVAYCIEHKKSSPSNSTYSDSDILNNYSARTLTGLRIILENGYPYATGGLSAAKARYATANAIRFWLSEQGEAQSYNFTDLGAYSNSELQSYAAAGQIGSKVRAKSGYTDVLQWSVELLIKARSQTLMTHAVYFSSMGMSVSGSYFVGSTQVTLTNMNGGYTLNTGSLPSGSFVSGYSGRNGDVLTVYVPMSAANSNRSFSISATGYDNRMRANMAAYDATSSSIQAVVTVVTGTSNVAASASLVFNTPAVADLTVSSLTTNKSSYEVGETVTVTAQIYNQGTGSVSSTEVMLSSAYITSITKTTGYIAAGGTATVTFTFTAPTFSNDTAVSLTATADPNNRITELNESNNSRSTGIVVIGSLPDLTVSSITTDQAAYEAGDTVTVTVTAANIGNKAVSSAGVKLDISGFGTQSMNVSSLAAGRGNRTVAFTFTAPTSLTAQTITLTATVDPDNAIRESNESNNTRTATLGVKALRPDLTITDTTATDWYAGKEVTVSATVKNLTAQPVPSVQVRMIIGDVIMTETICVPGSGSNLAVFRFTVPNTTGNYTVSFTADPDNKISEINENNNKLSKDVSVVNLPASTVLDPDDTDMEQVYEAYGLYDLPSVSNSTSHTWQEVRLESGSYITKTFWAKLTTTFEVSPDSRIAENDNPDTMESGYGVQVSCTTMLTTNYDRPEKLVGSQMVWVRYPESAYGKLSRWQYVNDSLEAKAGIAGDVTTTWQYAVNPWSVIGSRLHYTSLWYPDGDYTALAQAFYAWSPVGQLYGYETDSVTISGDMYDRITTIKR